MNQNSFEPLKPWDLHPDLSRDEAVRHEEGVKKLLRAFAVVFFTAIALVSLAYVLFLAFVLRAVVGWPTPTGTTTPAPATCPSPLRRW